MLRLLYLVSSAHWSLLALHQDRHQSLFLAAWVRHAPCGSSRLPHCHESNRCMHICSHELQAIIDLAESKRLQLREHGRCSCSCHAWDENVYASMCSGPANREVESIGNEVWPKKGRRERREHVGILFGHCHHRSG